MSGCHCSGHSQSFALDNIVNLVILQQLVIQMYKRKDNDIFGTSNIGFAPRIENNSYIDPNAAFKKKTEDNYEKYVSKMTNFSQSITAKPMDVSQVNESAKFDDNYHKNRKEQDLQSSIFYPPTAKQPTQSENSKQTSSAKNINIQQSNFGRKQTLSREINHLPYNNTGSKGNASRLFDLDERVRPKTQQIIPLAPLIPHQMQWDQHDSIRYAHINNPMRENQPRITVNVNLNNIDESKSTVFNQEQSGENVNKTNLMENQKETAKNLKKVKSEKQMKRSQAIKSGKQPVQIKIARGWDYKYMEGLSKHCKLNGTGIIKFETEEGEKATLVLKRSERWQNVTDWLRKDAKLKIRVINP